MAFAYSLRWVVSGVSTMITSAHALACSGVVTSSPAASARLRERDPSGRPTRTAQPESRRLRAWAWPCEP
jgi:hypothetical protein